MKLHEFAYHLPDELIGQRPVEPRDHSRLLVVDRATGELSHRHFYDLPSFLRPGDALVVNDTRVLPARLIGAKEGSGGAAELLLLKRLEADRWETLAKPGKRLKEGARISFGDGRLVAEVEALLPDGGRIVRFHYDGVFEAILDELGQMPLPPYITERLENAERYQTVYAREVGSAAAPTAGLHFTPELLDKLTAMGVERYAVTLHVGLGTFRSVKVENVLEHPMHSEHYQIDAATAAGLNRVRARGGRIVAVGTTSVRTLETVALEDGTLREQSGWTQIFIYPGYRFKAVDTMITNFHLPETTLLMLVSAFAGRECMLHAYETAVAERYRFFSFGDAMLIL